MRLLDDAKKFIGNVVCVGVRDDKLLLALKENKKASIFTIDIIGRRSLFRKRNKVKTDNGKKINIKKLRKTFKNKSIDNLIYDLDEMYEYFKYFIGDSIIITRGKIYIYGSSKFIDPKALIKRYKRYNTTAFLEVNGDSFTIIIYASVSHTNWFKNKIYFVVDTFHNIGDMISAALIS